MKAVLVYPYATLVSSALLICNLPVDFSYPLDPELVDPRKRAAEYVAFV